MAGVFVAGRALLAHGCSDEGAGVTEVTEVRGGGVRFTDLKITFLDPCRCQWRRVCDRLTATHHHLDFYSCLVPSRFHWS